MGTNRGCRPLVNFCTDVFKLSFYFKEKIESIHMEEGTCTHWMTLTRNTSQQTGTGYTTDIYIYIYIYIYITSTS